MKRYRITSQIEEVVEAENDNEAMEKFEERLQDEDFSILERLHHNASIEEEEDLDDE
jgi:hypothetical protein